MALTKKDLKEALNGLEKKIDRKMERRFKAQDDRFARLLMKHFYTKDEIDTRFHEINTKFDKIDTKFSDVDQKMSTLASKDYVKKCVDKGIDRVKVLYEALDTKMDLVLENRVHANKRIDELDGRVTKLERPV